MTDAPLNRDDEDDLLAAEYVTGLLDLPERVAIETRLRHDTGLAARVTDWENCLQDLNDDYDEVATPNLLPQIESRLFPVQAKRSVRSGLWSNLWAWGATATAAVAVAAYLLLTPAPPSLVATLDAGTLRYEAEVTEGRLTITRVKGDPADPAHSHELWLIVGNSPPQSLGVIPADGETISLPGVFAGQVLAITVEQAGGSPTGAPTTKPVAVGALTAA